MFCLTDRISSKFIMSHRIVKRKRRVIESSSDEEDIGFREGNCRDIKKSEVTKTEDSSSDFDMFSLNSDNEKNDVDDVKYLLETKKTKEKLSSEKTRELRHLVIQLRHQVPRQHQIEKACGSRVPRASEKEEFENLIDIKKGSFTPAEDQRIMSNWHTFCKMHNWDSVNPEPFLYMRHDRKFYLKMKERKKFVQFLADGLPNRTLYSVYHRFRNLNEPHLCSRYSKDEDDRIINYIENSKCANQNKQFSDLAKVLNRTRASVWRRYRLLRKNRKVKTQE